MFCNNCGTENDNTARFCKNCGQVLNSDNMGRQTDDSSQIGGKSIEINKYKDKIKSLPKKVLVAGILGIVVLVILVAFVISASNTINLNKYVTVETTGYDGFGRANIYVDWDSIEEKYGHKVKYTSSAKEELGDFLTLMTPVEALESSVYISIDKRDKLKNGDEITYSWNIEEDLDRYLKCKIKYKDDTIKVSGLEKVDTFDAFENLEVSFDGVSPNGNVNINYVGSELSNYDFMCDTASGLSNGDKITIYINEKNIESLAQSIGKIPSEASKEYIVEGLNSLLQKTSDLSDDTINKMKSQAEDAFNAYVALEWDEDVPLESFDFLGTYLLTAKSSDTWGAVNKLFLVYKATSDNQFKSYHQKNYDYWYIEYDNVVINDEGKSDVDITKYSTTYNSFVVDSGISDGWFGTHSWYYKGYATLNDLYKDVVIANSETYNHEDNVEDTESTVISESSNDNEADSEQDN